MCKLPRASGEQHLNAFRRAGWTINRIEGSHYILVKEGSIIHLSMPVHRGKDLGVGLLKKLIEKPDSRTNSMWLTFAINDVRIPRSSSSRSVTQWFYSRKPTGLIFSYDY